MQRVLTAAAAACLFLGMSAAATAGEVDAMLSDDYLEVAYARDAAVVGLEQGRAGLGLLLTEDNTIIAHGGLDFPILRGQTPLELWAGARLYLAGLVEPGDDVMGIGFGATARYRLPVLRQIPMYIGASIHYAPEVTTSGAGTDILDIHVVRGEIELAENVTGLVGLRTFEVDRRPGEEEIIDEKMYVGLRVRF